MIRMIVDFLGNVGNQCKDSNSNTESTDANGSTTVRVIILRAEWATIGASVSTAFRARTGSARWAVRSLESGWSVGVFWVSNGLSGGSLRNRSVDDKTSWFRLILGSRGSFNDTRESELSGRGRWSLSWSRHEGWGSRWSIIASRTAAATAAGRIHAESGDETVV